MCNNGLGMEQYGKLLFRLIIHAGNRKLLKYITQVNMVIYHKVYDFDRILISFIL